jgi:hypothetical protein
VKRLALPAALLVGVVAGAYLRSATAATPSTPLTFVGRVTNGGVALNSPAEIITVRLYDAVTGGTSRCQSDSVSSVPVVDGRFRVQLNGTCAANLATYGDLWAEVEYPAQNFFPRTKVSAVPYAVEALRAESAEAAATASMATTAMTATTATNATTATTATTSQALNCVGCVDNAKLANGTIAANKMAPGSLNHGHQLGLVLGTPATQVVSTFPGFAAVCSPCPAGTVVVGPDCSSSNSGVTLLTFVDSSANNQACCGFKVEAGGGNITVGSTARCLSVNAATLP